MELAIIEISNIEYRPEYANIEVTVRVSFGCEANGEMLLKYRHTEQLFGELLNQNWGWCREDEKLGKIRSKSKSYLVPVENKSFQDIVNEIKAIKNDIAYKLDDIVTSNEKYFELTEKLRERFKIK